MKQEIEHIIEEFRGDKDFVFTSPLLYMWKVGKANAYLAHLVFPIPHTKHTKKPKVLNLSSPIL